MKKKNNKQLKILPSLSEQLVQIFDDMQPIDDALEVIERCISQEYKQLECLMNPEQNNDVTKELKFYMADFLKNMAQDFKKSDRPFN